MVKKSKKNKLVQKVEEGISIGDSLIKNGRKLIKEGQFIKDSGERTIEILELPFTKINYSSLDAFWGGVVISGQKNINYDISPVDSTSGSAGTAIAEIYNSAQDLRQEITSFPIPKQGFAYDAIFKLCTFVETNNNKEEVISILTKFGFDKGCGNKSSPLESFQIGFAAYEIVIRDGNPSITSLISIRSCIDNLVSGLLRRRPIQEPAPNEKQKILSIGKQIKYDGVVDTIIEFWANEYHDLGDILSDAKSTKMSRSDWVSNLQRAMNFIIGYLKLLDPDKMKNVN